MYTRHKKHFFGLFSVPRVEWKSISDEKTDLTQLGLTRLIFFAAVPAISFFIGLTQVGWSLSGADYNKVTMNYAFLMAVAFYVLIVAATLLMAYFTFAMERAFGTEASFERCFIFVTYTATPMYMAGLVGFLPIVWLCMMVLMAAVFYSLFLLYIGIPIYMNIPEGKGFIVATSILSAGLCMMVFFNVATVIIWSIVV
jgi:hypothetical protein